MSTSISSITCMVREQDGDYLAAVEGLEESHTALLVQLKLCLALIEDENLDELHGDLAECVREAITKAEVWAT